MDKTVRIADVLLASLLLFATLPIWIIVVPVLWVTGEGHVFFRQPRVGKGGKMIHLLKFTTMLEGSSTMGAGELTLHDDPRVLPVGRWLRKTKINELPQLINVINGDMSLVGARPQTPKYFLAFSRDAQDAIKHAKPGLTGLASIMFRDEETILASVQDPVMFDLQVIMPYKGRLEKWYLEHSTFKTYLLLVLLTAWVLFVPKSQIYWRWLKDLPPPPVELEPYLSPST